MYTHEGIIIQIIMSCGVSTPDAIKFRFELGFKQHDITLSKEQSVLSKILKLFLNEKIQLQHSAFGYRADLYFFEHKLVVKVDEKGHTEKDEKGKREKKIKERTWL